MSQERKEENANLWMYHMRRGEFDQAWEFSDKVLESHKGISCWHLPRHLQYIWDGTPLNDKRVLVRCYHGLGDTIQFVRYAPLVKAIARQVMVWAQAPLIPLLKKVEGIDQLFPLHDGTPEVDYDVDVEIMELPHIFRTAVDTIPLKIPYLQADPIFLSEDHQQLAVGLVWKAGDWDERRHIPFECLAPLNEIEGVWLYILQENAAAGGWKEGYGVHPGEFPLHDYARVIAGLDLVISVDSMPAHLAGALGKPVWNLLHAEADWRWMNDRDDSPWYPTMQLFRQQQQGDWATVIEQVKQALIALKQSRDSVVPVNNAFFKVS